jgi:hypothetical protein
MNSKYLKVLIGLIFFANIHIVYSSAEKECQKVADEVLHTITDCKFVVRKIGFSKESTFSFGRHPLLKSINNVCNEVPSCSFTKTESGKTSCRVSIAKKIASKKTLDHLMQYIGEIDSSCRLKSENLNDIIFYRDVEGAINNTDSVPGPTSDQYSSCFYVSSSVIVPANSSCGRTPACIGVGFCNSGPKKGAHNLFCEAVNNRCPDFKTCSKKGNRPSWINTGERYNGAINPSSAISQ